MYNISIFPTTSQKNIFNKQETLAQFYFSSN